MSRTTASIIVAAAFLVTMIGTTMPTPLYPLYQAELGFNEVVVTVVFATYAVGVIAALLATGRLSDQLGRKPVLLAGMAFALLSGLIFLIPGSLVPLFAGRLLSGFSAGVFTGTATATIVDLVPQDKAKFSAPLAASANMLGLGLGPVLAGLLAQYAPWPLTLPYLVHSGLLVILGLCVLAIPEPVQNRSRKISLRVQRLVVPEEIRPTFRRAAVAGFAGFAVLGFFTAVSSLFLGQVLHVHNHAITGVVVFALLGASTVGQLLSISIREARCLVGGCVVLAAGIVGVGIGVWTASMALFVIGAVVAGLGQGMSFRAGLSAVTSRAPQEQRSSVSSAFFFLLYIAISIPVIGVGAAAHLFGLVPAAVVFAGLVAVLAIAAAISLARLVASSSDSRAPQNA